MMILGNVRLFSKCSQCMNGNLIDGIKTRVSAQSHDLDSFRISLSYLLLFSHFCSFVQIQPFRSIGLVNCAVFVVKPTFSEILSRRRLDELTVNR